MRILVALMALFLMTSCKPQSIVGIWVSVEDTAALELGKEFQFYNDKTFTILPRYDSARMARGTYEYINDGKAIVLKFDELNGEQSHPVNVYPDSVLLGNQRLIRLK